MNTGSTTLGTTLDWLLQGALGRRGTLYSRHCCNAERMLATGRWCLVLLAGEETAVQWQRSLSLSSSLRPSRCQSRAHGGWGVGGRGALQQRVSCSLILLEHFLTYVCFRRVTAITSQLPRRWNESPHEKHPLKMANRRVSVDYLLTCVSLLHYIITVCKASLKYQTEGMQMALHLRERMKPLVGTTAKFSKICFLLSTHLSSINILKPL